jgi:sulfofructose kinase
MVDVASDRILCVGALTMDTIFRMQHLPDGPGKFLPIDVVEIAEGMAASAACSVARLGGKVALWSSVGDDAVGARGIAAMEAEGVDCELIRPVPGIPSAISTVLVDEAGERMIVPFYHRQLWESPVPATEIFAATLVDIRWPEAAELALVAARNAGRPGILDADVGAVETLRALAPHASHIIASRPGAALLTGMDDPEAGAALLAAWYDAMVVVTAGEAGSYWVEPGGAIQHTPAPKVVAVDTTAAGDVFHGAFTLGLTEGMAGAALVQFASAAAAVKCTRFGGRLGAPDRSETEALMRATYGLSAAASA